MIYIKESKKNNNGRHIKKVSSLLAIVMFVLSQINVSYACIYPPNLPKSYLSDEFPSNYKAYVDKVKKEHPNWILKAVYTGLDWNQSVSHESYEVNKGISTININDYGPEWIYQGSDIYKDGPYYTASKQAVEYTMDPRNFLNDKRIFQFETLSYSPSHNVDTVQKLLSNTPMGSNEYKNKYKKDGKWEDMQVTYAQMIYDLSKKYEVSPIHISSRIKQENSGDIVNKPLINGSTPGYIGFYNFFNIGAYPDNGNNSVINGLKYAKDANPAWTTPKLSIEAGIKLLKSKYIAWGQDTIYFQKFDVNNPEGKAQFLYGPPYMTNIMAPANEGTIMYDAYNKAGAINDKFEFHIPVYNNMPNLPAPMPTNFESYFEIDSTMIYLDDASDIGKTDEFWIRSEPDGSNNGNIIEKVFETKEGAENRRKFLRTGKGIGINYDRIVLEDGRIGYIVNTKNYIKLYDYVKVENITISPGTVDIDLGNTLKLEAEIAPTNAYNKEINWSSSDSSIVSVDNTGNIVGKKVGKVVITATTKDQEKSAIAYVNVHIPITSITTEKPAYTAINGSFFEINTNILPVNATNKEYIVSSSNENVVKYINGKYQGVGIGDAIITLKTKSGNKTTTAKVSVIELTEDNTVKIDNTIKNENGILSKIYPLTSVESFLKKITYDTSKLKIEFKSKDEISISNGGAIGTNTKMYIKTVSTGDVIQTYNFMIRGDATGDGDINSADLLIMRRHLLGLEEVKNIFFDSIDISKDKTINSLDLLLLRKHLLGSELIIQ